jgi:hypothetical protein
MKEPAEDWYRYDPADEDFFNILLRSKSNAAAPSVAPKLMLYLDHHPGLQPLTSPS